MPVTVSLNKVIVVTRFLQILLTKFPTLYSQLCMTFERIFLIKLSEIQRIQLTGSMAVAEWESAGVPSFSVGDVVGDEHSAVVVGDAPVAGVPGVAEAEEEGGEGELLLLTGGDISREREKNVLSTGY